VFYFQGIKMTIQDWGAIGEIVGAVAVLATLIYLAREVRHSANVAQVTSYHQAIDQIVQSAMEPDFAILTVKLNAGEELTQAEQIRAQVLSDCFLYSHEILLHLNASNQVDKILWANIMSNNMPYLQSPMMLPRLRSRTGDISKKLLDLVEKWPDGTAVIGGDRE
jgi:hypothetical protein